MNIRHLLIFFMILLTACGTETAPPADISDNDRSRPLVIASNYPLYYFASAIAADSVDLNLPVMEGDPANWNPGAGAIAEMQRADLVLLNGAGYESWLGWVTLPENILLDTSAGITDRLIPRAAETVHQHGPEGEHSHTEMAFTVWLDPMLAIEQARAIEQSISKLVPEEAAANQARLAALESRLKQLDLGLRDTFDALGGQPLIFSHPVYQYLAARYGINGASLHWEPDQEPGTRAWLEFQQLLNDHPARIMIWEAMPLQATAERLRKNGVEPVPFLTASNRPAEGDYFSVMEANIARLIE